jgi:hypothetical protein
MESVIVFGNSGFCQKPWFHLIHDSLYEVVCFSVDRAYMKEDALFRLPVVSLSRIHENFD